MQTESTRQPFEQWALIEIMGHQRLAGHITEEVIAGIPMLRIDVPAVGDRPPFTQYVGGASIYRLTIVTEEVARQMAASFRVTPVQPYEVPELRELRLAQQRECETDLMEAVI